MKAARFVTASTAILFAASACSTAGTDRQDDYWGDLEANAVFRRAERYFEAGRYEAALVEYRRFLAEAWTSDKGDDAAFRIAQSLENLGDRLEAADAYRATANRYGRSSLAPEALLRAGAIYAVEGYPEEARLMYEWIATGYGDTEASAEAGRRLKEMGPPPEGYRPVRIIPRGRELDVLLGRATAERAAPNR